MQVHVRRIINAIGNVVADGVRIDLTHDESKHFVRMLNNLQYTSDSTDGDAVLLGLIAGEVARTIGVEGATKGPRDEHVCPCMSTSVDDPPVEANWV